MFYFLCCCSLYEAIVSRPSVSLTMPVPQFHVVFANHNSLAYQLKTHIRMQLKTIQIKIFPEVSARQGVSIIMRLGPFFSHNTLKVSNHLGRLIIIFPTRNHEVSNLLF